MEDEELDLRLCPDFEKTKDILVIRDRIGK